MRMLRSHGMDEKHGLAAFRKCNNDMNRLMNYLMGVDERGVECDYKDFDFGGFEIETKLYDEDK